MNKNYFFRIILIINFIKICELNIFSNRINRINRNDFIYFYAIHIIKINKISKNNSHSRKIGIIFCYQYLYITFIYTFIYIK